MTEKQPRPDTEYQWRYLNGRHRLTRHLVPLPTHRRPAVCGIIPA